MSSVSIGGIIITKAKKSERGRLAVSFTDSIPQEEREDENCKLESNKLALFLMYAASKQCV